MAKRYDLVVVGGGTAGLVSGAGAASLGARVALVERDRLGGDCLYRGCVPTKALVKSARVAYLVGHSGEYGVESPHPDVDFPAVMARMRTRIRAATYVVLTALCIVPGSAVYTFAGGSLASAGEDLGRTFIYLGVAAVFVVVSLIPGWLGRKGGG